MKGIFQVLAETYMIECLKENSMSPVDEDLLFSQGKQAFLVCAVKHEPLSGTNGYFLVEA